MEFERKDFYTIEDLLKVVEILRHPEYGCEWDRVQTHLSVRKDFIEETYEAVDAIDNNDKELMIMYDRFYPGRVWLDTDGKRIQAHGGSIFYLDGKYYWYGENKEKTLTYIV